ncbi:PREDICTED: TITAN-like protein isoform X2 [Nelumbo nucifera]|uniref:TITAN-like protein isoform X2 n=2 Tax=Nelumbo nucifera TaxID=4432 RepID=A0A1U7ZGW1_NELNU|nr:PREDICTED: TITAN-like protein isoform X2 [Nelumbo nucifera]DAD34240.1 TPA_asm: hypothetical protein HUJ06_004880 [Nelumbo nucifera]
MEGLQQQQQQSKRNPMPNNEKMTKKNKKNNKTNKFEFCKVCNLNHDQGRRHIYFPNHIKSLSSYLSRFHKKLSDVRFFLKNPSLLRPEHAPRNRLWCVFCDSDIEELDSLFACGNAITHFASAEHLKNLNYFLWKYGGGMDRVDSFRISDEDVSKWEKKCESLKSFASSSSEGSYGPSLGPWKDIQNKHCCENTDSNEKNKVKSFKFSFSNSVLPLQCSTKERYQVSHPETNEIASAGLFSYNATSLPLSTEDNMHNWGMHLNKSTSMDLTASTCDPVYSGNQHSLVENSWKCSVDWSLSSEGVDRMGNGKSSNHESKGNVHTGAPPPWFEKNEENELNFQVDIGSNTNSLASSSSKSRMSGKLNPKRVGAAWAEKRKIEIEMEKRGEIVSSSCDTDWLPNFGRVWQSGTRKESRKEFEMEKHKLLKVECLSEGTIKLQPYISKRMRKDTGQFEGPADCS